MSDQQKRKTTSSTEKSDDKDTSEMTDILKKIGAIEESVNKNNQTLRATIKDMMLELKDDLVKSVEKKIEVIECSLHEALTENETLKAELKRLEHEVSESHRRTRQMGNLILSQSGQMNDFDQYGRRNNVRINGIPENQDGESAEDTTKTVVQILNNNIKDLNLKPTDIDISHRLGKRHSRGHRQIIMKFISRHTRDKVIRNRKSFKGQKIFINEDLTKLNQAVLTAIRTSTPADETGWSWDGKIYHKTANGQINLVTFDDYSPWLGQEFESQLFNGQRFPS